MAGCLGSPPTMWGSPSPAPEHTNLDFLLCKPSGSEASFAQRCDSACLGKAFLLHFCLFTPRCCLSF